MREKKQFENGLDDSVAHGLNTGTEILMNQVGSYLSMLPSVILIHVIHELGRAHHPEQDRPAGVLSRGRLDDGSSAYRRL